MVVGGSHQQGSQSGSSYTVYHRLRKMRMDTLSRVFLKAYVGDGMEMVGNDWDGGGGYAGIETTQNENHDHG